MCWWKSAPYFSWLASWPSTFTWNKPPNSRPEIMFVDNQPGHTQKSKKHHRKSMVLFISSSHVRLVLAIIKISGLNGLINSSSKCFKTTSSHVKGSTAQGCISESGVVSQVDWLGHDRPSDTFLKHSETKHLQTQHLFQNKKTKTHNKTIIAYYTKIVAGKQ